MGDLDAGSARNKVAGTQAIIKAGRQSNNQASRCPGKQNNSQAGTQADATVRPSCGQGGRGRKNKQTGLKQTRPKGKT